MVNFYHFMKNFKSTAVLLLLMIFAFGTSSVFAQTPTTPSVNITVTISSPYSPFYSDYAGPNADKVLLIIQNLSATQKNIKLTGELQGDNGIRISTKSNYVPLQPIILGPNETKQLNGLALKDIFDLNSLNVYGVDKVKIVQTSRLPEGNYSFCIKAVDMANNQVLSATAPMGCSSISIVYPDAPALINPLNNTTIPALTGQSFVWMNYLPLVGITYDFQVAEMPSEVRTDPNQVLNSTSIPLIQRTVANSTSTILSPSDPPLKAGKRYAWRVIASDPTGKIVFKNKGISAAAEFRYGEKAFVPSVLALNLPTADEGIEKLNELHFKWTFTDNSSQNDNVGFYNGFPSRSTMALRVLNKYELHITKLKSLDQKAAERRAIDERIANLDASLQKISASNLTERATIANEIRRLERSQPSVYSDNGIFIPVNNDNIEFKSSPAMAAYLKDGSDYEWTVKDMATGIVSEKRNFMLRGLDRANYKLALAGSLRYNFRNQYQDGATKRAALEKEIAEKGKNGISDGQAFKTVLTEKEAGFPLADKNISVLKVTWLAPTYKVTRTIKAKLNGVDVTKSEVIDSIAPLSDVSLTQKDVKINQAEYVAKGTTDAKGNFNIDVPISNQYKVIDPSVIVNGKNYALVQGLVVKVNDNRFSDPNWYVVPQNAGMVVNLGEATVECYSYKVNPELFVQNTTQDFKGKLYVLRKGANPIKGEVDDKVPEKKDVPIYKTNYVDGTITASGVDSYSVVGLRNINIAKNKAYVNTNVAGQPFLNFVDHDEYAFYFEPENSNTAIYYSLAKRSNNVGKKEFYENTTWRDNGLTDKVSFKPQFIAMQVSGRYVYNWKQPNGKINPSLSLPEGVTLKLVKADKEPNFTYNNSNNISTYNKNPKLINPITISTTTVKKNGEYSFDVGIINYDDFSKQGKYLVVLIDENSYYYSQFYTIDNYNQNVKLPDLTAKVKQFSYKSSVVHVDDNTGKNNYKQGAEVYLCRKVGEATPSDRPINDGDPEHKSYFKKIWEHKVKDNNGKVVSTENYEVIDKATAMGKYGIFSFNRLVMPKSFNENYYIFAEAPTTGDDNYLTTETQAFTMVCHSVFDKERKQFFKSDGNAYNGNAGNDIVKPIVPPRDPSKIIEEIVDINFYLLAKVKLQLPYIDGAVYPQSNTGTTSIPNVHVEMFNMFKVDRETSIDDLAKLSANMSPTKDTYTNTNGRFVFENVTQPIANGWKLLRFTKAGFLPKYIKVNGGNTLLKGQRANLRVELELPKIINVTVLNSDNQKITARVIVGDDFSWMDYLPYGNENTAKTPKGYVKFTIIPADRANNKITTIWSSITDNTTSLTFKAAKVEHSIIVRCYIKDTYTLLRANVNVLNGVKFTQVINANNTTTVTIPQGSTQFNLRVKPIDMNYTIAKTQVQSNGLDQVVVNVYVEPAATLTLKATEEYFHVSTGLFQTIEKRQRPSSDFNYYIEDFDADEYEVLFTNVFSTIPPDTRIIKRLPKSKELNIGITKEGFVGGIQKLASWSITQLSATLNLKISDLKNVNTLHGFPIELTAAIKQSARQYLVSGWLNPDVGNNGYLKASTGTGKLKFTKILVDVVSLTGVRDIITPVKPLFFEQNSIDATLFDTYNVKITNKDGLALRTLPREKGSIVGKVAIDPASLAKGVTVHSSINADKNYLYLNDAQRTEDIVYADLKNAKESNDLQTFSTLKSDLTANKYWISTASGSLPTFAGADDIPVRPDKWVQMLEGGILFNGNVILTNLENVKSTANGKEVKASGLFYFNNEGLYSYSTQPIDTIKLNQWGLKINNWNYGTTGFMANGLLNTQGLTIPFRDLAIYKNKIGFGKFDVTAIKLLNTFPVALNGSNVNVSFGFDKGYANIGGAWAVSVSSKSATPEIATLKGLEDIAATDAIKIKNINIYDTGDENDSRINLIEEHPQIGLNRIAKFRPNRIWGSSDYVTIRGSLDMDVPGFTGLGTVTYDLTYRAKAGKLVHVHEKSFKNIGLDTKGMLVKFKDGDKEQIFNNGTLELTGFLKDKDQGGTYEIPVKLSRTINASNVISTTLVTTENIVKLNKLDQTTYLERLPDKIYVGESYVNAANQWEYFKLNGYLNSKAAKQTDKDVEEDGIKPSKMEFVIKGEVVANSAELGVKNMGAGPMKSFSIVYDFVHKALIGSGHISQDIGFAMMELDAELKIGNATDWYIMASGKADIANVPIFKSIGVAFMVGNAQISGTQQAAFYKHFIGDIKPSDETLNTFKGHLKGVLFMVSTELKLPLVPTFNLNLKPIASVQFDNGVYAATYFKLNFNNGAEIKIGGRAGAYVKLSAGASIGLACAGVSLSAEAGAEIRASLAKSGDFSAALALNFRLGGSAYVGIGMCDSDCETICVWGVCSPLKCYRSYYSKVLSIGVEASLSQKGLSLTGSGQTSSEQ